MKKFVFQLFMVVLMMLMVKGQDSNQDDTEEEKFIRFIVGKLLKETWHPLFLNGSSLRDWDTRLKNIEAGMNDMSNGAQQTSLAIRIEQIEILTKKFSSLLSVAMNDTNSKLDKLELAIGAGNHQSNSLQTTGDEASGSGSLTIRKPSISATNRTQAKNNTTTPGLQESRLVCGGVLVKDSGQLTFEARRSTNHAYTCIWTIRAGNYAEISVTLDEDNFAGSMSQIRLTPLDKLAYRRNPITYYQRHWSAGDVGSTHTFWGPIFLELIVDAAAKPPPKFRITFSGSGSPMHWNNTKFEHLHLTGSSGNIAMEKGEVDGDLSLSYVIVPRDPLGSKGVTLTGSFIDLRTCNGVFRIWKIEEQKIALSKGCKETRPFTYPTSKDNVGWIIVMRSFHGSVGMSFNYTTRL